MSKICKCSLVSKLLWLLCALFWRHSRTSYALLFKKVTWKYTDIKKSAIYSLCTGLCCHPVLAMPDFTKPFCIESDASDTAEYSVSTQKQASIHKPIAFLRKTSTSCEHNYSIHDHELLAIVTCCKAWCPYIDGQYTLVLIHKKTSHSPPHLSFTQ